MKLHPREQVVTDAENEVRTALVEAIKKYELTTGEELRILANLFGSEVGTIAKYIIRQERHGNTDTPGGLE